MQVGYATGTLFPEETLNHSHIVLDMNLYACSYNGLHGAAHIHSLLCHLLTKGLSLTSPLNRF